MKGLVLVVVLFGFPLFVGLGKEDIRGDETIYSFAVDRILETGDWLDPKSIPDENASFLEKPPLKFWIVAAPMKIGLLSHDEFGMRFWDALFGAIAFIYVFLIGSYLIGPVCGAAAVLVLFAHGPLLFTHGLRGNNMEAPLVLSYCGGIYHFMAWARRRTPDLKVRPTTRRKAVGPIFSSGALHAHAVGLYFVLGFMTKFVAAVFLPMVLGAAVVLISDYRGKIRREWRLWTGVTVIVLALVLPWFLWAWRHHGGIFWSAIFSDAVVTRMTTYLDPMHVQPWHFYATEIHRWLSSSGVFWLAGAGLAIIAIETIRRRWPEGLLILLWAFLPLGAISFGNSKLYHYTYPFLPPIALAVGYVAAIVQHVMPVLLLRAQAAFDRHIADRLSLGKVFQRRAVRAVLLAVAVTAVAIAIVTIVNGPIRLRSGSWGVFRSSSALRPLAFAAALCVVAGARRRSVQIVVAVLVLSALPVSGYRESLSRLNEGQHPMRAARDCIRRVETTNRIPRGMYVDVPATEFPYPHYYYFRTLRPWKWAEGPASPQLSHYLNDPAVQRPILVWEPTFQQIQRDATVRNPLNIRPPMVVFRRVDPDVLLLLPGPYAACIAESGLASGR